MTDATCVFVGLWLAHTDCLICECALATQMDESKIQVLPPDQREFPFAPQRDATDDFDASIAVDMSPYCCSQTLQYGSDTILNCQSVARSLLTQLRETGFCYVRGTGISSELCHDALSVTNAFLQNANEDVRRSTMTMDRARRGYSPMCTENFSSLVGQHGPNDLVRKFRMGPSVDTTANCATNSLLQRNVWPDEKCWDVDSARAFRSTLEMYYKAASRAAQAVVLAICDGLLLENPELQPTLDPFMRQKEKGSNSNETCCSTTTSSILTCLGYRVGTRHKGNDKGPLVAPHTDVGVITMLLFDNGNCASLQRSDGKDGWVDVHLPSRVPRDPIFVVNVADCLSEMSQGNLPSTLHQVVAKPAGKVPRNCCALFVGLEPEARLLSNGTEISYEEWRKLRILRAQNVLRSSRK
jgi:isopenicillin N synthase-like dioxygenase